MEVIPATQKIFANYLWAEIDAKRPVQVNKLRFGIPLKAGHDTQELFRHDTTRAVQFLCTQTTIGLARKHFSKNGFGRG